jgi:CRP/FNR family cyclic AMP-dependent transcriptional regulator
MREPSLLTRNSAGTGNQARNQSNSRHERRLGAEILSVVRGNRYMWSTLTVEKNASIYSCGKVDSALYVVESGRVKTMTVSRGGKECLLDIYAPGEVLGEASLLGARRAESATAMSRSTLTRIPAGNFLDVLNAEGLTEQFLHCVIRRVTEHQQAITRFVTVNSETRLAMTLLRLGRKLGWTELPTLHAGLPHVQIAGPQLHLDEKITHEELAEMVGTTRTRIGSFLKKFHSIGLIDYDCGSFLSINETRMLAYLDAEQS